MIDAELWKAQMQLAYAVLVAGKSAKFADAKMKKLFPDSEYPFDVIQGHLDYGSVASWLQDNRTGSYTRLSKCFSALPQLDPINCSISDLEAIHGIGPKTARFFILWTRPGARCAALDTHILKWLRIQGYDAPKSTPQAGQKYEALEKAFLEEADKRNMTPRELDLEIWSSYAKL